MFLLKFSSDCFRPKGLQYAHLAHLQNYFGEKKQQGMNSKDGELAPTLKDVYA